MLGGGSGSFNPCPGHDFGGSRAPGAALFPRTWLESSCTQPVLRENVSLLGGTGLPPTEGKAPRSALPWTGFTPPVFPSSTRACGKAMAEDPTIRAPGVSPGLLESSG